VYERQVTEDEIVNEHVSKNRGGNKPNPLPSPPQMRALVDERIRQKHGVRIKGEGDG